MTTTEAATEQPANAIHVRPFRLPWLNNVCYFLVSNAQRFVFGWLVLDGLGRSERDQGITVFALGIPAVLLVLNAGAWADRLDRRKILIVTQIAGGLTMVVTAVLIRSGNITFGWVIVVTVFAGAASAIGQPVLHSLIPAVVPREQPFSAIALNAIAMTLSPILGPVVAKLFGDRWGFDGAFWFQAILMLFGVVFLLRLDVPARSDLPPKRSVLSDHSRGGRPCSARSEPSCVVRSPARRQPHDQSSRHGDTAGKRQGCTRPNRRQHSDQRGRRGLFRDRCHDLCSPTRSSRAGLINHCNTTGVAG